MCQYRENCDVCDTRDFLWRMYNDISQARLEIAELRQLIQALTDLIDQNILLRP
jgi:hypothetical protein